MKLFSTCNFEIPTAPNIPSNSETEITDRPCFAERWESHPVTHVPGDWRVAVTAGFCNTAAAVGKKRNETRNVTNNPIDIIQPKSITGLMLLNTREPNAKTVVNAV